MTSLSAQEEGRAFVEAAEVTRSSIIDATRNSATRHFYKLELGQLMSSPKPIKTLVFQAAQLHGTYFKYKAEDEDGKMTLDNVFQRFLDSSLGANANKARNHKETVPLPCQSHGSHLSEVALGHQIDAGYGWKIEVVRDPTANSPPSPPTPEKIGEANLLNTLD
eukprot:jgi/Psemu1/24004/gm1.24004_g